MPIPRPTCECRVCKESRRRGGPHQRMGPGLFIEGPDLLFDTTEEIRIMLNRARVSHVAGLVYTHWHPDHTAGWRILEQLNATEDGDGASAITPVYIPQIVWEDFEKQQQLGMVANLEPLVRCGWARIEILQAERPIKVNNVQLEAIPMREARGNMHAFLLENEKTRILLAVDHLLGWQPPARLAHVDVAVLEAGWPEYQSNGAKTSLVQEIAKTKTPFNKTLQIIQELKPKSTYLTHIPHYYGWTYDDYVILQEKLNETCPDLVFAYDGLIVDL